MTEHSYLRWLLVVMLLVFSTLTVSAATERDLYIGDTVTLSIDGAYHTEEGIRTAFADLEIVSLIREEDSYRLTLRTFEPGTYEVELGRETIVFEVASSLDAFDRDTVFPAEPEEVKGDLTVYLRVLLFVGLACALFSGIWLLVKGMIRKKDKFLSPYESLTEAVTAIDLASEGGLGSLNHAFKGYIYKTYQVETMGMTSGELIRALRQTAISSELTDRAEKWLLSGDGYKYRRSIPEHEVYETMASELLSIAEAIETERQVEEG